MLSNPFVPPDVLASIPAGTGGLRHRTRVLLVLLAIVLAGTAGAVSAAQKYHVFGSPLVMSDGAGLEFLYGKGELKTAMFGTYPTSISRYSFGLGNVGLSQVRILSVELHGDGFEVRAVRGPRLGMHQTPTGFAGSDDRIDFTPAEPLIVPAGEGVGIAIDLHITDCRVVGSPDLTVTIESRRGRETLVLSMHRFRRDLRIWRGVGFDDPLGVGATRAIADIVCDYTPPTS